MSTSRDGLDVVPAWVADTVRDTRTALRLDTVADATGATRVRREFTTWLGIDVENNVCEDIVLAVYEALANAAEHAYDGHPDGPGTMWLTAHRAQRYVRVRVADRGQWRPDAGSASRGRGLELMRSLMTHVHLSSDAHGTVVQLRTAVPPSPLPDRF